MDKNFESHLNPKQQEYIYKKLLEKYEENFKERGINEKTKVQICNMAEFLIAEHPEKYAKSMGIENNYRSDENLQKIYAVISQEKEIAVLINTNEKGKIPQGEFGVYDLKKHEFELTNKQMKNLIKERVEKMSNGTMDAKEEEELIKKAMPKTLEDMDRIATVDMEIEARVYKLVDKKIDEKNEKNSISKEEREEVEEENRDKKKEQTENKKQSRQEIPENVAKECKRLGITNIKAFMEARAEEFVSKTDIPYVNRNAGNVLIIRADSGKNRDKYYVFQNNRLCVPGNKDEELDQIVRKTSQNTKNGALLKPIDIDDEEQYFEYSDSQGTVIREKLEENMKMSTKDLRQYKKAVQNELEKFSQRLSNAENDPDLTDAQKDAMYRQANEIFNRNNSDIAKQYDIDFSDVKAINLATDQRTKQQEEKENEAEDEIEAWEVPGKIER